MAKKFKKQLGKQVDSTKGSIIKSLFHLSWPIILSNLMHMTYNLVDTIWVGKVGAKAVAAISLSFPIVFVLLSLGIGFTIAGTTLVAQYTGAEEGEKVNHVVGQIFSFVLSIALFCSVIGIIFTPDFLKWMGASKEVLPLAVSYMRVLFGGMTFMFIFFIFSALLRGSGNSITPMKLMFVSTLINIILDPFLIFGVSFFPELGVTGAAVATIFSRAVVAVISIYFLWTGKYGLHLKWHHLKFDFKLIKEIVVLGAPAAIEQSTRGLGMTVMMSIVAHFGTMAVAAFGICTRILSLVIMPSRGFSTATTTMVGQNLGANKVSRAEKSAYISTGLNFILLSILGAIFFTVPQLVIKVFNDNPEVIRIGSSFIQINGLFFGFMGGLIVINGGFRGAGNTLSAMFFSIFSLWIIRIPLANIWSKVFEWGTNGIWWAFVISNVLGSLTAILWFKRGHWKKSIINKDKKA
ncbi:MATE family efflux transporter [Acetohalobium arabaticum]|uniref:Probable multidrug resistance protein NorM n=1 Tax=Acetohalobium arabaticum (strain ATCC 49924 / DSM 5501 / Z-7288) TaxID=574087 RepID=D9QS62_ACEAZ|nr:MATE family efflux transporter [Acetohalobium arabaticum]ADL13353.1 MATE efflux family protein [Acetohalobium arabaticum DSM 5501]